MLYEVITLEAIGSRVRQAVDSASRFAEEGGPADERLVFDLMFTGQQP